LITRTADQEDGGHESSPSSRFRRSPALAAILTLTILGTLGGFLLAAVNIKARREGARPGCANNLKKVGLASISYCDDKRFFPHMRGCDQFDGDYRTSDGPRAFAALERLGYLESADVLLCPGTTGDDSPTRATNPREPDDLPLSMRRDLSYGWSRRCLTGGSLSMYFVACDRAVASSDDAVGNHDDCRQAVCLDGHFERIALDDPRTGRLDRCDAFQDGCLGIFPVR
jgi:hypothetical protein